MKTFSILIALLALAGTAAPLAEAQSGSDFVLVTSPAEPLPEPAGQLVQGIRSETLAAHIKFLASVPLAGRGLGSPGLEAAAEYIAAILAISGVPPLPAPGAASGKAAYFQEVPFREVSDPSGILVFDMKDGARTWRRSFSNGVDCLIPPLPPGTLSAPVIFAGYGIREKKPMRDDYLGLDVKGKIVLIKAGLPKGEEWKTPALVSRYAAEDVSDRFREKVETARALGAAAVLAFEEEAWAEIVSREKPVKRSFFRVDDTSGTGGDPPLIRVSAVIAEELLGVPLERGVEPKAGTALRGTVAITATGKERLGVSRNVIAFVEGSDAGLKSEAVVIGAHMDHLGDPGGVVHPGADDNASGVSALIEIVRGLSSASRKPRRSVAVTFFTGEEEGHIGSEFYVRNAAWPLAKTTVYVNLDMIGHPWARREIEKLVRDFPFEDSAGFLSRVQTEAFAEPGLASWARDLAPVLTRAGQAAGISLHFDWTSGEHGGSDYRAFARLRIPFVRFFGSFFPGYHEPIDSADRLDATQVQRVTRLAAATVWLLAER